MKRNITNRILVFTSVMLMSMGIQAQNMTPSKVKDANVIVLLDKDWEPFTLNGNMIEIQLNDKTRPAHKKNEILIHENMNVYTVELDDDFAIDDEEIAQVRISGGYAFGFVHENSKLSFWILNSDKDTKVREYQVEAVMFYNNNNDILKERPLGMVTDMNLAYMYISQVFLAFTKWL